MRFTIVTPVMNGMPWLPECIASVDAQRADCDVQHVILDPGSKDGSREWLRANAVHAELVFEKDAGQTDALIRGFSRATGDVLGWLNADDVFEPRALARAAQALHENPASVGVSGAAIVIDGDGKVTDRIATPASGTLQGLLASPGNLAQPSTLFRADAYRAVGGLDASVDLAMDVALWLRLAKRAPFTLLPDVALSRFRIHAAARSVKGAARTAREDLRVRRAAGMSVLSPAGLALLRYGYVQPLVAPLWRRLPARVRVAVRGKP